VKAANTVKAVNKDVEFVSFSEVGTFFIKFEFEFEFVLLHASMSSLKESKVN